MRSEVSGSRTSRAKSMISPFPAGFFGPSYVSANSWNEPLVVCESMITAGSQRRRNRNIARVSGASALTQSRLRSRSWALCRSPWPSTGPIWFRRLPTATRSAPSGL